jgi:hypothetical protein
VEPRAEKQTGKWTGHCLEVTRYSRVHRNLKHACKQNKNTKETGSNDRKEQGGFIMLRHDSEIKKISQKKKACPLMGHSYPNRKKKEEKKKKKRLNKEEQILGDNSEYKAQVRHEQTA